MAKAKKEETETKFDINELARKLQIATNAIAKDLKVKPMGFEAPRGTNGSLSTGSLTADLVTGGGFPKHRMTTVSGDSGAGKTTLVQKALGKTLDRGLICHYVDVEGAADYAWMLRGGTDMNKFLGKRGEPKKLWYIPDFQTGEDAFRYIERNLVEMDKLGAAQAPGLVSAFFLDSLAAMIPAEELENDERGDSPTQAKMFSRWIRLIRAGWLKRANSAFIAINQIRENPRQKFGSPEYEPGGAAPTFYADVKLWLRRTGKAKTLDYKKDHALTPKDTTLFRAQGISIEKNPSGTEDRYFYTNIKAVKNRVFPPFKETYMRIWTEENGGAGRGIDPVWDTLRFFEEIGMAEFPDSFEVKLKGKVYSYYDLKAEILAKPDLQQEAWSLLQSGNAFDLYFARLAGGEVEVGKPDDESPDEAEEAGEAGVPA